MALRKNLIEPYYKSDTDPSVQEELDTIDDVLSKSIVWNTPVQSVELPPVPIDKIEGIVIGRITDTNEMLVDYPGNPTGSPLTAIAIRTIKQTDVNREVALSFKDADPHKPIVLGFIEYPQQQISNSNSANENASLDLVDVNMVGQQMIFSAEKEIVLKCGKASITLTRAGKIILRGKYLLSRSSGVNQIKGGSVQIN